MSRVQTSLSSAFLWTALLLATYFLTGLIAFRPLGMLYRDAGGLEAAQNVASWAARATFALSVAAAACVAVAFALRGGTFVRRILNVVPIWLLTILAIGAIATFFKVGTVGGLAEIEPIGGITFATAWLLIFGILTTLVIVPVTARAALTSRTVRSASTLQLAAAVAATVTTVAMVVILTIAATATPAAPGGPGGPPGGGPGGPPPGGGPSSAGAAGAAGAAVAQAAMAATAKQNLAVGVALMVVFSVLVVRSSLQAWRARAPETTGTRAGEQSKAPRAELPGAVVAALVLTGVVLILIQPFRLPVDNPPASDAAVWDSPVTADLVGRTCMDCHSNEGTWPWYAHVAPSNWLTAGHVRSARKAFNLSELDKLEPDRRESLGERMARSFERGNMPPADYRRVHPQSELTETEAAALMEGLKRSLSVAD